ncbi:MAG: DUF262 domain-containing protein [Cryobacterium sp.]|nr:DUF262 domain-containing protein [Cryobacterium sp.]
MNSTASNVDASAVNTIRWLATGPSIVVPVYQRQYRWEIDGCEQLLNDIRRVSDDDESQSHFLGSILSSASTASELVLIDGQQRITTIMLLVAALQHTIQKEDPELASELGQVLFRDKARTKTTLRPHLAWADTFREVLLNPPGELTEKESRFHDNYSFFRSQVPAHDVAKIWRGLQRLEHVSISLNPDANAQQVFESLNSTGAPLRDHELIHNYILMGLSHEQQLEIETEFWEQIEANTGDAIGDFWRHLMILTTGMEVDRTNRAVYEAFREFYPRLDFETLRKRAEVWRDHSKVYAEMLNPDSSEHPDRARHLNWLNGFGRTMYPLIMRALYETTSRRSGERELIDLLETLQSILIRRTIVGLPIDRLVARFCRAWQTDKAELIHAISRITPSDERVRVALKYTALPLPAYVLTRLFGVSSIDGYGVDHIAPLNPSESWNDGRRSWSELAEDEQNSIRALAPTLGNLALIEDELAEQILDAPFGEKSKAYSRSGFADVRKIADAPSWTTRDISARTAELTKRFVQVWPVTSIVSIDDDGLVPILDAKRRKGWPTGWNREFDYVEYRGEHWEVPDVKYLFNRVFKRLWADSREAVIAFSAKRGGPIFDSKAWNGSWDQIDADKYIYMGWDSGYMLAAVQGVLSEAGIASEVFIKYSYLGEVL